MAVGGGLGGYGTQRGRRGRDSFNEHVEGRRGPPVPLYRYSYYSGAIQKLDCWVPLSSEEWVSIRLLSSNQGCASDSCNAKNPKFVGHFIEHLKSLSNFRFF